MMIEERNSIFAVDSICGVWYEFIGDTFALKPTFLSRATLCPALFWELHDLRSSPIAASFKNKMNRGEVSPDDYRLGNMAPDVVKNPPLENAHRILKVMVIASPEDGEYNLSLEDRGY